MAKNRVIALIEDLATGSISRRDFIKGATAAGMSVTAIGSVLASTASAAPTHGGSRSVTRAQTEPTTLVIADSLNKGDWITADPAWFFEINSSALINVAYERLYDLPDSTKPLDFIPRLAADFPVLSEDGSEATITLRQGVKFHNSGNEMTSADVVFSWNRLKNIKYQGAFLATEFGTAFEAIDPYTVKLTTGSPRAALLGILAAMPLSITDSAVIKANGGTDAEDADKTDTGKEFLDGTSAGTGPYKLAQWDLNGEVITEKHPEYWGEPAKLDRIIWRNVNEVNTQLQLVESGDVDIAYSLDPDAAQSVRDNPDLQLLSGPTLAIQYFAMHTQEDPGGPTANKALRQAVAYAIDYQGIVDQLLVGAGLHPATTVPEPLLGTLAVHDLAYTTDLAKAQKLFDSTGLSDVEITFSFASGVFGQGGVSLETLAAKLQADIEQINGLKLKLNPMEGTARLDAYRAGKLQSTVSPWTPDYVDVNSYTGPFAWSGGSAAKRVGYANAQVDEWIAAGIIETDPVAREEIYVNIMKQMIEDVAFVVLYQTIDQKAASKAVTGTTTHSVFMIQLRDAAKTA